LFFLAFFLEFADVIRPALRIPVFVTGGFQTAAAMIKAIKNGSTDGIGLARPICEEPHLPKQLIEGKVHAKVDSKIDYDDFGSWNPFAGMEIRRVGFGMPTADSTDERVVKDYLAELKAFFELTGKKLKEGVVIAGHPRFGTPALPGEGY
jgi:tRNA-dihydrouridine synthase